MVKKFDRKLVLEDGSEYYGYSFGDTKDAVTEIVFDTSMVGYQEIIFDPSYTYQTVVMTYPLIGNCGIADDNFGTKMPTIGGLVVREYNNSPSNFRYTKTLSEVMEENQIPGIYGIDTRKLTRSIRDFGSRKVLITNADTDIDEALKILRDTELKHDAVSKVSCKKRWYSRTPNFKFNVVAVDCGIKQNTIQSLNKRGCNVTVVPWNTSANEIEMMRPDGIYLSDGPGNPEDVPSVVDLVKNLQEKYPIFGIGLGYQLISLAYGAKTCKLKFGHRGGNHPIRNLMTEKIEITSQNHSYVVDAKSVENTKLMVTHINLLDNTVEGVECKNDKVFGVQYHPESAPEHQDSAYLFNKFIDMMKEAKNNA